MLGRSGREATTCTVADENPGDVQTQVPRRRVSVSSVSCFLAAHSVSCLLHLRDDDAFVEILFEMVRPRLVEEGKPIGSAGDDESDHSMADDDDKDKQTASLYSQQHSKCLGEKRIAVVDSSLARAVVESSSSAPVVYHTNKTKRQSYRTVIGGTTTDNSDEWHAFSHPNAHTRDEMHQFQHSPTYQQQRYSHSYHHNQHRHHHRLLHTPPYSHPPPPPPAAHATHMEIGLLLDTRPIERMEGVIDQSIKAPLIVFDGANIAYSYGQTMQGTIDVRPEPDARGIRVAVTYFQHAGLRVLVVLPMSWIRSKPHVNDPSQANAKMQTDHWEVLQDLHRNGLLLAAPPTDDDDAYALTIAQRELSQTNHGGDGISSSSRLAYVVSNDLFRDAQRRDTTQQLSSWLTHGSGGHEGTGPGRISYAFCDTGRIDEHGERELDFVPNPRHPLTAWIERILRQSAHS